MRLTLLVPTDFSAAADKAINYAIEFAKKENAKIVLLHAFYVEYPGAEISVTAIDGIRAAARQKAESALKDSALRIEHAGNIDYELIAQEAFPIDAITQTAKQIAADFVIMGTKGNTTLINSILGSTTAKVIEEVGCPVIAIPSKTDIRSIKNITYATNYDLKDINNLRVVAEIARTFNAHITILHIADEGLSAFERKMTMEGFSEKVRQKVSYPDKSFDVIAGENVPELLEQSLRRTSSDLLVMMTHHHGFFSRLFGESVTRKMAYQSSIPLMIVHETTF
jgi:nucleotide-binding universal stress UspA family protein